MNQPKILIWMNVHLITKNQIKLIHLDNYSIDMECEQ